MNAAQVVDHAHRHHPVDVRRTAVAQPGALDDQQIETAAQSPLHSGLDVGDEEMVGAQPAGQAGLDSDAGAFVALLVIAGETVELDDADLFPLGGQSLGDAQDHRGLAAGGRPGHGRQAHQTTPFTAGMKMASISALRAAMSWVRR